MTHVHRVWHARLWAILGPLILGGLAVGLWRRPQEPLQPVDVQAQGASSNRHDVGAGARQ